MILVVFLVVIVLFNVLATSISSRFTIFSADLTKNKQNSISDENVQLIKSIDKPTEIIFAASEQQYTVDYAQQQMQVYVDPSGGDYFAQTVRLIKRYNELNPKIQVKFVEMDTPDFNKYYDKFSSENIESGDIIVSSTFENSSGKQQNKFKVLRFEDIYNVEMDSTRQFYSITGSNVETSVTSALFYCTAEQQDKITLINGYGSPEINDSFLTLLKYNNYDFDEIENLAQSEIPNDTNILMLIAPIHDLSDSDIKKIDDFLLKSGSGKNLLYFASGKQPELPNLDALLSEWGMKFEVGTVYETNSANHVANNNTIIELTDTGSDLTKDIANDYYCSNIRPMNITFEEKGNYYTEKIIESNPSAVIMPRDSSENWTPNNDDARGSFATIGISTYVMSATDENSGIVSRILSVASNDFIHHEYSQVGRSNQNLLLKLLNNFVNRSEDIVFNPKVINKNLFTPNQTLSTAIKWIFVWIMPIIIAAVGIAVYLRRRKK